MQRETSMLPQNDRFLRRGGAAVELGFKVLTHMVGDYAGGTEILEIGSIELRQVRENRGERGAASSDQRQSDIVGTGPAAVLRDSVSDSSRKLFAGERFQDLRFGEIGVVEDYRKNLRMAFTKESTGDPGGSPACQCDFLSERKLRQAGEKQVFGDPLEFGWHADR